MGVRLAASQDDSRGDTKEKGCCDEGVAWEGPLEFYRTPDRAEVAPNELDVTLCNGLCSQWRGCKALKPILIQFVENLCSNRVKHLAHT